MSPESIKRKKSALDFNAIEAEPFIKALKDRGDGRIWKDMEGTSRDDGGS